MASLVPRPHPVRVSLAAHNTESDQCWGWFWVGFGFGTETKLWLASFPGLPSFYLLLQEYMGVEDRRKTGKAWEHSSYE